MTPRTWAAALACLLLLPAARAASFDCAKASTPVEQAICRSPVLGSLDDENAKLYSRRLQGAGSEREAVIAMQRQWLREDRNKCKDDACVALSIWQQSGMLRTSIERGGAKTTDIPEVATTAQELDKLLAGGAKLASSAPVAAVAPAKDSAPAAPPPKAGASAAVPQQPSDMTPVGPRLTEPQAQAIFNTRLGRCAAAFGVQKAYDRAEQLMAGSSDRRLTRGTYVALLQQSLKEPSVAKENYMDACRAIGIVNGFDGNEVRFEFYLTAYEAATPAARPEALRQVAAELSRRSQEMEEREAQLARDLDPAPKLQAAYLAVSGTCAQVWRPQITLALKSMGDLRRNAAIVNPRAHLDPNNSSELAVRQVGDTVLNAMKRERCIS